ncbi:hypothetical protein JAAARDRAFT_32274, partial [Jaapia argillacea MUCL 33604]
SGATKTSPRPFRRVISVWQTIFSASDPPARRPKVYIFKGDAEIVIVLSVSFPFSLVPQSFYFYYSSL